MAIRHIMLIDDDFDDAELFAEALTSIDTTIQFTYYDDARAAVEALLNQTILPDILLLDINLPSFSGWQCLAELKKSKALTNLPVIMYTTSTLDREKELAKDLGASGFITKPQSYRDLKEILKDLLSLKNEATET